MLSGRFLLFAILIGGVTSSVQARQAPFVPVDDPIRPFLNVLLLEGAAPGQNPVAWPLSQQSLVKWTESGAENSPWAESILERLRQRLPDRVGQNERLFTEVRTGIRLATQDRRDLVRWQDMDDLSWQPMVLSRTWMRVGSWTASLGVRVDRYYEVDPDGQDTAHRWLSRAEDAYVSRDGRYVDLFLGRMGRHWGAPDQPALILSRNPRPMDHLGWRVGTERLNVRSVISELDSFTGDGRMTGTAGADSVRSGSMRRMLAAHRLTVRISDAWTAGLMHATLYSGPSSGLSLKFANPFNVALWEIDNRPKNDENNGMMGAFFSFRGSATLASGEVLLDDVDILNGKEPASLAATLSVSRRGVLPRVNATISGTAVTAKAFNSEQVEGRYVYLGRGIGTQQSDYVHVRGHIDFLHVPGWLIRSGIDVLRAGEADFRMDSPSMEDKTIFTGTPQTTVRPFLQVHGLASNRIDVTFETGWNRMTNMNHVEGATTSHVTAALTVSYRMSGSRGS